MSDYKSWSVVKAYGSVTITFIMKGREGKEGERRAEKRKGRKKEKEEKERRKGRRKHGGRKDGQIIVFEVLTRIFENYFPNGSAWPKGTFRNKPLSIIKTWTARS